MPRKPMNEDEALAAATAIVKKQTSKVRKRPDLGYQTDSGDNTRITQHTLRLMRFDAVSLNDAQKVQQRIDEFFQICCEDDIKPSVASLALALGYDRNTVWKVANGRLAKPPEVVNVIKKAYIALNAQLEMYMSEGKIKEITGIFLGKNNFGYVDKQEIEVSANQSDAESPDQLAAKYADAVAVDFSENDGTES